MIKNPIMEYDNSIVVSFCRDVSKSYTQILKDECLTKLAEIEQLTGVQKITTLLQYTVDCGIKLQPHWNIVQIKEAIMNGASSSNAPSEIVIENVPSHFRHFYLTKNTPAPLDDYFPSNSSVSIPPIRSLMNLKNRGRMGTVGTMGIRSLPEA